MSLTISYSKAESEIRFKKIKQLFGSGLNDEPLHITDPTPTTFGGYILADVGIYPSIGTTLPEKWNVGFLSNSGWEIVSVDMPQSEDVSPEFDPSTATKPQGGKQIAERYDKVSNSVDSFLNNIKKVSGQGAGWAIGMLRNNNTTFDSQYPFIVKTNIPTEGFETLQIRLIRASTVAQNVDLLASLLGIKADGSIDVLLSAKNSSLSKEWEEHTYNIKDYVAFSVCYDLASVYEPDFFRPTITLSKVSDNKDSVLNYINTSIKPLVKSNYNSNVKSISVDIDDFTGTDDEKIEKATAMVKNVKGGSIYFPNRQINITKAFLIESNIDYVVGGQIQMVNGKHDNIFRPKNLIVNPDAPSDKCLDATWTENFTMNFLPGSSIRQSVVPLHTGGQYGWRGISALFVRCRDYEVRGLNVIESHMWSISNEFCERGKFYDIKFNNTLYINADGLNFRNGCRDMYAKGLRGFCTDNAVATTILDSTIPPAANAYAGYSYQAMGWTFGDFNGADEIVVEDCQVAAQYGQGLIIASGFEVSNITYKDFISTVPTANDWDNVAVCANQYRGIIYGTSYQEGNLRNVNIINSKTTLHEYSLSVYGQKLYNLFISGIENTNLNKLGDIQNLTTTVFNLKEVVPNYFVLISGDSTVAAAQCRTNTIASQLFTSQEISEGKKAINIAVPGHTIAQQHQAYNALSAKTKASFKFIFIQIGLNDCVNGNTTQNVPALQQYINSVNLTKSADAKVILSCMLPCKSRWQYINDSGIGSGVDPIWSQQAWVDLNRAIMNTNVNPIYNINNVDFRNDYHVALLDDGNGNLNPIYDCGDKIHENQAGADIIIQGIRNIIF